MYLALMEEEAGVAEGAVMAQGTTEFSLLGVLAVLVIKQGLLVFGLVAAVLALEDGRLVALRMFCLHVFLQLVLALASKATYLTDQGLALVTQLVAAQLVSTMAAVGALVTLIPGTTTNGEGDSQTTGKEAKDGDILLFVWRL